MPSDDFNHLLVHYCSVALNGQDAGTRWFEAYIIREPKDITAWLALLVSALSLAISYSMLRRERKKQWEQSKPCFSLDVERIEFTFRNVAKFLTSTQEVLPEKMRGAGWRALAKLSIENRFESNVIVLNVNGKRIDSRQPIFLSVLGEHFKMDKDYAEMVSICENPMYVESKHTGSLEFWLIFPDNTVSDEITPRVTFTIFLGQLNSKGRIMKKSRLFITDNILTCRDFISKKEWERF